MKIQYFLVVFLGKVVSTFCQEVCHTPNAEEAKCVPAANCWIKSEEHSHEFFEESRCGPEGHNKICCGSLANYHENILYIPTPDTCGIQVTRKRIFGGQDADIDEFPWLASLLYEKKGHGCGGALINEKYVLTAAHCIKGVNGFNIPNRVRLGEYNFTTNPDCVTTEGVECCNQPYQEFELEDFVIHPQYNEFTVANDIALIRIKRKANLNDFVRPVCLPFKGEESANGVNLDFAGWGTTVVLTPHSKIKLKAEFPKVDQNECKQVWRSRNITDAQFCAGIPNRRIPCAGDSGGPLVRKYTDAINYYAEGISSFGYALCDHMNNDPIKYPAVFTRVSKYTFWILNSISPYY